MHLSYSSTGEQVLKKKMAKKDSNGKGRGGPGEKDHNKSAAKIKKSAKGLKLKSARVKGDEANWIASLAKKSASNVDGTGAAILSKEDRKQKRELKKNRRIEQQRQKQLQQQRRRPRSIIRENADEIGVSRQSKSPGMNRISSSGRSSTDSLERQSRSSLVLSLSKGRIVRLSKNLQIIQREIYDEIPSTKVHRRLYYDLPKTGNKKAPRTSYTNKDSVSSKKSRKRKWSEDSIQPRRSDYSGIGLARISMYIQFADPSFFPKLEEEFQEHIPGFFGKQRTKAMKRQTDGNMLWRRLANEKKNNSKKFKGMSTDDRVQAMIEVSNRADLLG